MESHIGALFENAGLILDGKPVVENIRKAKASHIFDLFEQIDEITSYETIVSSKSIFTHTASASLGGGRTPCENPPCRIKNIKELTQFSSLYSDKVYIRNFLHDYIRHEPKTSSEKSLFIKSVKDDLIVFSSLLPLVDAGIVQLVTFANICPHCLSMKALHDNSKTEYEKASKDLENMFNKDLSYSIKFEHDIFEICVEGSDFLLPPHGSAFITLNDKSLMYSNLFKFPKIVKKAIETGEVKLTTAQARKLEFGKVISEPLIQSVAFELGCAHYLKTSYLSDSDLEIKFISELNRDPIARRRTSLMSKYLTCLVPFIEFIDASSLMKLRDREQESFILFRAAISKAIEEYKSQGHSFTERDAQSIYADIIQPRLASLDSKINKAKSSLRKDGYRKIIGWAGSISVGILTGIFTTNPIAGATAFGATKIGAEFIENIMAKSDVIDHIKEDDFYFLWKVKEMSKVARSPRSCIST